MIVHSVCSMHACTKAIRSCTCSTNMNRYMHAQVVVRMNIVTQLGSSIHVHTIPVVVYPYRMHWCACNVTRMGLLPVPVPGNTGTRNASKIMCVPHVHLHLLATICTGIGAQIIHAMHVLPVGAPTCRSPSPIVHGH